MTRIHCIIDSRLLASATHFFFVCVCVDMTTTVATAPIALATLPDHDFLNRICIYAYVYDLRLNLRRQFNKIEPPIEKETNSTFRYV